jgi:hypothetical protein
MSFSGWAPEGCPPRRAVQEDRAPGIAGPVAADPAGQAPLPLQHCQQGVQRDVVYGV